MNNSETLQQHNNRLGENNANIDNIINIIESLPNKPSETIKINENGVYDVTNYAIANVDVLIDTSIEDGLLDNSLAVPYTNNRITSVAGHKFRAANITSFSSTSVKTLNAYCFNATPIQECNTPNVETIIGGSNFASCTSLKKIYFPKTIGTIGAAAFQGCISLEYACLGTVDIIGSGIFNGCTNLTTVVLTKTSVTTLNNVNVFSNTPIEKGTGYIYVPDDLVESYKTATNWSTFSSQIKGLSELPQEV